MSDIQAEFSKGGFSGPSHIHGNEMPGLAALKAAKPGEITIVYKEVGGGAELTYGARDAKAGGGTSRVVRRSAVGPRRRRNGPTPLPRTGCGAEAVTRMHVAQTHSQWSRRVATQ